MFQIVPGASGDRLAAMNSGFAEPAPDVVEILPGEVWRDVDLEAHFEDREGRKRRQRQRRHMKVQ